MTASRNMPRQGLRMGPGGGMGLTGESARNTRSTIVRLFSYLKPFRTQLLLVAGLVLINTLLRLAGPILLGQAIDNYVVSGDAGGVMRTALWMIAVYVGAAIAGVVQGFMMVTVGQQFVADIREQLFSHIQTLSMAYHDRHRVGDLMSRISNDSEAINRTLSNGLIEFTSNILLLGGIMVAMFFLNWQLVR